MSSDDTLTPSRTRARAREKGSRPLNDDPTTDGQTEQQRRQQQGTKKPSVPFKLQPPVSQPQLHRRKGRRFESREQAEDAQDRFLATYALSANISVSAREAGVSRPTVYWWQEHDEIFAQRFQQAENAARDALFGAVWNRAVFGWTELVVNSQGIVYETEPVRNPDGSTKLDAHGRPILRRGKPATVRKYSDSLALALLKAKLPEFREKAEVNIHGSLDIIGLAAEADKKFYALLAADAATRVLGEPDPGTEG